MLPCTSLLAKPKQKKLGQIIAWHNSSSFDQGHLYASLLRYVFAISNVVIFLNCVFYVQYVHLNVVGSRYANLALLCILLPHELPPCVCKKIWVQTILKLHSHFLPWQFPWDILYFFILFTKAQKLCVVKNGWDW